MNPIPARRLRRLVLIPVIGLVVTACGSAGPSDTGMSPSMPAGPSASALSSGPSGSAATEPPGGTTSGDVPDNAVFLTFTGANPAYSIQYVEGWQVTTQPTGVVIRDKDSSETVSIGAVQPDVAAYVGSTDLPALQTQPGFKLIKQDTVKVGSASYIHLAFHITSPPDSVTGKQVAQTVDRYYVTGPKGLAVVSLATPDGVDNVDAFRQMIESFKWL